MAKRPKTNARTAARRRKGLQLLRLVSEKRWDAIWDFLIETAHGSGCAHDAPCRERSLEILKMKSETITSAEGWTEKERDLFDRLIQTDLTYKEIGERLGRSERAIQSQARRAGVNRRGSVPRVTEAERNQIVALAKKQMPVMRIAEEKRRSQETIRRVCKEAGIPIAQRRGSLVPEDAQRRAKRMRTLGYSWQWIAGSLGYDRATIRRTFTVDPLGHSAKPGHWWRRNGNHAPAAVAGELRGGGPFIQQPSGGRPASF